MKNIQDPVQSIFIAEEQTIAGLFSRQVGKDPFHAAVSDDNTILTYEQLEGLAGDVARIIVEKTGKAAARVCVLAPQSVSAVVAVLGVLKAGKCFVPMLPQENDDYLCYLWKNSDASLIVCDEEETERAARICGNPNVVVVCKAILTRADIYKSATATCDPDSVAAIMYTSGSTGQPKGVMTTGQAILERAMFHIHKAQVTPSDHQASCVPWQFASSFPDIFAPLLTGACLFMYDNRRLGIERLALWIRENAITLLKLPAALVRRFVESATSDLLTTVRYVQVGGGITVEDAKALLALLPEDAALMHGFGSTETNLATSMEWRRDNSVFQSTSGQAKLPAGYPVFGKKIEIVDDEGHPVASGEEGELVVTGRQLFTGYWKQPEMTAQCLKSLPDGERAYYTGDLARIREDGNLEIIGRKGYRVKIRGLRIDLGAVESMLRSLPYVRTAAAVVFFSQGRDDRLIAYLETTEADPVTTSRVRQDLKKMVPDYMIPSRFIMMEALPQTANGKIDRVSLPAPGRARPDLANAYEPPCAPLEHFLAEIWAEVLNIDNVGIHDPFLELGGDSLLAMDLGIRIQEELEMNEPLSRLLQASTIAQMAQMIGNLSDARPAAIRKPVPFLWRLRNFLKQIKRKIISASPGLAAISPSYESFLRLHKFWLSLPPVRFLYRNKIRVFRQWLDLTGQTEDALSLATRNLMANTWFVGREFLMAQKKIFEKWTSTVGEEHLRRAAAAGRGAILVFPHTRVFFPSIRKRLASRIFSESHFLDVNELSDDDATKAILVTDRLKEARNVLRRGGAVWLAGDGLTGAVRKVLIRSGRQFPFRSGAANLAAKNNAPLILVFPNLRADGMIEVEFLEPLVPGPGRSQEARIADLLRQYAEIYVDRWPRMLPNMTTRWQRMRLADIPNNDKSEDV
jgi:amino acid adenylation domain-containing protein